MNMSKFPLYRQHDAMQCGVACLRMVCAHFGRQCSMQELSELCPTTSEGVSMLGISRAAEELGLHTACGRLTVDVLATAPLPCILHWNQNHFVVLHRISGRKGRRSSYSGVRSSSPSSLPCSPCCSGTVLCRKRMYRHLPSTTGR